jgi:hypothetical protein
LNGFENFDQISIVVVVGVLVVYAGPDVIKRFGVTVVGNVVASLLLNHESLVNSTMIY